MKKTLSIALIIMLLVSGLFILTGCGNNADNTNNENTSKEYSKEVEIYTVQI